MKTYNARAREFAATPDLVEYRATITTVKQHLSGTAPATVTIYAPDYGTAERKMWDIVDTLEDGIHELSAHRIYEYQLSEVPAPKGLLGIS